MRISDWSSDVCSSDLAARPRGQAVQAAEHVEQRGGDGGRRRDRSRPGAAGARLRDRSHDRYEPGAAEAAERGRRPGGGAGPRGGQRQGARIPGDERATAAAGRSEEHTSELQSLMRISYAVFCLKKKKPK